MHNSAGKDGSFEIGPVIPGSYTVQVDVDDDGFPKYPRPTFPDRRRLVTTFPSVVPDNRYQLHCQGWGISLKI